MDIRKVKKLIELLEESDLTEIEVKEGEDSVRISRAMHTHIAAASDFAAHLSPAAGQGGQVAVGSAIAGDPAVTVEDQSVDLTGEIIRAPMVGTFYRAPSPGSPPFVEPGSRVKVGDTLCIIESMKMMNEVKAEVPGIVEAVLVRNEDAVEFDQPMFTFTDNP